MRLSEVVYGSCTVTKGDLIGGFSICDFCKRFSECLKNALLDKVGELGRKKIVAFDYQYQTLPFKVARCT